MLRIFCNVPITRTSISRGGRARSRWKVLRNERQLVRNRGTTAALENNWTMCCWLVWAIYVHVARNEHSSYASRAGKSDSCETRIADRTVIRRLMESIKRDPPLFRPVRSSFWASCIVCQCVPSLVSRWNW